MPSSDGLIVVEAAPREVVLLALGLLRTGRALGRGGCCAGGGDALALAAGCGVGSTLDAGLLRGGRLGVWDGARVQGGVVRLGRGRGVERLVVGVVVLRGVVVGPAPGKVELLKMAHFPIQMRSLAFEDQ